MAICHWYGTRVDRMPVERRRGGKRVKTKAHTDNLEDETMYTPEEVEFMKAMDAYKRDNHRPFPTWSEVFAVLKSLGYRKDS